jgi:type I restriction enzyme S subunit
MSDDLPMGWVKTELGEISQLISGKTPKDVAQFVNHTGSIPWVKVPDMNTIGNERYISKSAISFSELEAQKFGLPIIPLGSVIFSKNGGAIATGKKRQTSIPCSIDLNTMAVVPNGIDQDFLFYWFKTVDLASLSDGSVVPQINKSHISPIKISLPPLNEQRRIVDKLDRIGDRHRTARNELSHIPKLCDRYKQAILAAAYTNLLERESIPRTLGECSIEVRNGLSNKPSETQSDIKILRISAVRQGRVNTEDVRFYIPKVNEDITRYYLQKGDLLFTRYNGNTDYVAVCGMFMEEVENFVYPDKLIRVRVNSAIVTPEFIELIFQTPQVRETLRSYIKTSAGQHGISGGDLKSITIPVPSITSQRLIVENTTQKLNFLRAILREHETIQSLLDRLEQATLAKAFRGELVPQDPSDEPASVLLEQVKREKAKGKKGK